MHRLGFPPRVRARALLPRELQGTSTWNIRGQDGETSRGAWAWSWLSPIPCDPLSGPPPANRAMSGAGEGVGVELSPHRDCSQSPGRRRRVLNPRYNQSSLQTSCTGTGREDSGTKWCWSRRIAFFKHSPVFVVLPSASSHCGSDGRFALQGCTGALVLGGKNKEN